MNDDHQIDDQQPENGAPWWQQMITRREAGARIARIAAGALILPALGGVVGCGDGGADEDVESDALDLQKESGWDVGSDRILTISDRATTDSRQQGDWKSYAKPDALLAAWGVRDTRWQPFVVPTLVQSLAQPSLATMVAPVHNAKMDEAYRRGLGMREILLSAKNPEQVTIVADLPGPEAVAFAAALADVADPVLTFDNWPHPEAVVPAQQTLGALMYYAGEVAEKKAKRSTAPDSTATASAASTTKFPSVFILDSDRLDAPVSGSTNEFDNRYIAKLPDASTMKSAGVTNVMYAVPDASQQAELDDLNDLFTDYREDGVNVSMVPLSDFKPATAGAATAQNVSDTVVTHRTTNYYGHSPYYYGGGFMYLPLFFHNYPSYGYGRGTLPAANRFSGATVSRRSYVPTRRATVFSSRTSGGAAGVGRTKPSGFGRVSRSSSSGSGGFSGSRSSGSYGRARGGSSS